MPRFTASDGVAIHYEADADDGRPTLVLSHALATSLEMWDGVLAAARARFRVVRYDGRGLGRSEAPAGPYVIGRLGRDAIELLDALGIPRAHFCGLSLGGMVGMWLGAHAGDRIDRLALCNTAPVMPPPEAWDGRIATVAAGGMAAVADGTLERWFTAPFRAAEPEVIGGIAAMIRDTAPAGYAGCCAAIRDMDQRAALPSIAAPTLVLTGADDAGTSPAVAHEIAAAIPGARVEILERCAHLSAVERPDAFAAAVFAFLAA